MSAAYAWEFPARKEKGAAWYAAGGAALAAFVGWGFLMGYAPMSAVALLLAGIYLYMDNNSRGNLRAAVGEEGVEVAGSLYDYGSIGSYSVIYERNRPAVLRLRLAKASIVGQVDAELPEGLDVPGMRAFLAARAAEDPRSEFTATETVLRLLKL